MSVSAKASLAGTASTPPTLRASAERVAGALGASVGAWACYLALAERIGQTPRLLAMSGHAKDLPTWRALDGAALLRRAFSSRAALIVRAGEWPALALPIIAEDLGVITPDVEALRDRFGFPGMKILQFAFGSGSDNPYLPHNYVREAVVYTGTHDNDTTAGWFASLPDKDKKRVLAYTGHDGKEIVWELIRTALASVAATTVIPLQDILSLGTSARMNIPGTPAGNWSWRFAPDDLNERLAARLRDMTELYGRQKRHRN